VNRKCNRPQIGGKEQTSTTGNIRSVLRGSRYKETNTAVSGSCTDKALELCSDRTRFESPQVTGYPYEIRYR